MTAQPDLTHDCYTCTHMETVGVKGLSLQTRKLLHATRQTSIVSSNLYYIDEDLKPFLHDGCTLVTIAA